MPESSDNQFEQHRDGSPSAEPAASGEHAAFPSLPDEFAERADLAPQDPRWPPHSATQPALWTLADLGLFLLFALGTMVLVGGLVLGGFSLLNKSLHWGLSADDARAQTPIAVLVQILWESLWLAFIYQIVVVKYRQGFWSGVRWAGKTTPTARYLLGGGLLSLLIQLLAQHLPERPDLPIEQLFNTPASAYLLAFFGIVVAPFMEELVFRGFVFPVLERRWGAVVAVLSTGALFAAIHAPQLGGGGWELVAMLAVGLILSTVRALTGSLMPSFLMHLGYNSSLFILLFISTNRFQTLSQ